MSANESQITSSKITSQHLERLAYIYVRQSTPKQVEHNRESQVYQYRLSQRAQALGWRVDRTHIIDADLGLSARDSQHRDGFQELIAKVSLGQVGIIFGYEVSRLARNNRDWYHLLDLAAVFGTLIADADGIYDPRLYNDRLLLGLKGTMSEAELHWLKMRLEAGKMNKVRGGAYQQPLPTGLIRLPDGTVVKDPDQQLQRVIVMIFTKFAELGSCRQLLRFLKREQILIPRRHPVGRYAGQLMWKSPTDSMLLSILHNPAYAGAFAHGQRQYDPVKRNPHRPSTGNLHRPMDQWHHLQQNVYPAYISWEQYLANQEKLKGNSTLFEWKKQNRRGPARQGEALLQGLVVCGLCSGRMRVGYGSSPRYLCYNLWNRDFETACCSLHAPSIDEVVQQAFFEALRPAQLDALETLLKQEMTECERLDKYWRDQLRRAEYEARLAQKQYDAVDPDNRLVATELERRWEEKLQTLRQVQEQYERFQQRPPSPNLTQEQRRQFEQLSENLPALWPDLPMVQRKELLRALVSQVILKRIAPDQVEARIIWVSGHYTIVTARQPTDCLTKVTGYDGMVERIHQMWCDGWNDDQQMAAKLTEEGFYSARGKGVSGWTVRKIRLKHQWYKMEYQSRAGYVQDWLTPSTLAEILGVEITWVYKRLRSGVIASKYVQRRANIRVWMIENDPELIAFLKQLLPTGHKP